MRLNPANSSTVSSSPGDPCAFLGRGRKTRNKPENAKNPEQVRNLETGGQAPELVFLRHHRRIVFLHHLPSDLRRNRKFRPQNFRLGFLERSSETRVFRKSGSEFVPHCAVPEPDGKPESFRQRDETVFAEKGQIKVSDP